MKETATTRNSYLRAVADEFAEHLDISHQNRNWHKIKKWVSDAHYTVLSDIEGDLTLELWYGALLSDKNTLWVGFASYQNSRVKHLISQADHPNLGFSYSYRENATYDDYYADLKRFPIALYTNPVYEISEDEGEWCGIHQIGHKDDFMFVALLYLEQALLLSAPQEETPNLNLLRARAKASTSDLPVKKGGQRTYFQRCRDVKLYALCRSDGVCECCGKQAPFQRQDGTCYLEVHHMFRLADGGPDSPEHVAAVCPTCHRLIHHGLNGSEKTIA